LRLTSHAKENPYMSDSIKSDTTRRTFLTASAAAAVPFGGALAGVFVKMAGI